MKCKRWCWSHVQCLCSGIGVPPRRLPFAQRFSQHLFGSWKGNGRSQQCGRMLSADHVFSATLPSPAPSGCRYGHLGELCRGVRQVTRAGEVSRADAILVASRCLSPLERQPHLSDKRLAHRQDSFPRMVCTAPTTTARPSSSAHWFPVFCQAALSHYLLRRKMWEVTVRVPATTRQITRGSFGFCRT